MHYKIFSLYPQIFTSFWENSLIARAVSKNIISYQHINWKDNFGHGNYKQVDDRPFGGGTGMVLQPEQIYKAMETNNAISKIFIAPSKPTEFKQILPNNQAFFEYWLTNKPSNVTISLTPRGFPLNQNIVEWLASFSEISILCGRFEGFDARVSSMVDVELSIGNFVTNGGEVPAMVLIEAVSRFLPNFITKSPSVLHDSFSNMNNQYSEFNQFLKKEKFLNYQEELQNKLSSNLSLEENLFNNNLWLNNILPYIEHPQFTRPENFMNMQVPEILKNGDHKQIANWREFGWKK